MVEEHSLSTSCGNILYDVGIEPESMLIVAYQENATSEATPSSFGLSVTLAITLAILRESLYPLSPFREV